MASPAKHCAKEKAALWKANKEKIGHLISCQMELNQIEEELQRGGCRITSQLREYIIWEMRAPEVRDLLAQGFDVAAIEEKMRLKGWIWTDNLRKKALWEFHREEIITLYKAHRSVEPVREIMVKKGFLPQVRIYYEWLRCWGVSTGNDRHKASDIDDSSPHGGSSSTSGTPGSIPFPHNHLPEAYESAPWGSSHSIPGDMVSSGNGNQSFDASYQSIAMTVEDTEGHVAVYEADASKIDVDEENRLGNFCGPSGPDIRPTILLPSSGYHHEPSSSATAGHRNAFIKSDNDAESHNFHQTATEDDTTLYSSNTALTSPQWFDGKMRSDSKDKHASFPGLQRTAIHQNKLILSEQIAVAPMAHRVSIDSGYGSSKSSILPAGLEYASSAGQAGSLGDRLNEESSGQAWGLQKSLLRSISCPMNHQDRNFNFHCCGSSYLQELAFLALNFSPQQMYQQLCNYMKWEGIRLWDHAGNTFLHKLAITGVPWAYFEAGLEANIDPFHRNAYGQSFTHVLDVSAFHTDLMECLSSLKARSFDFGLRDASGRTFLHCLYSQPISPQTARQILKLIDVPGRQLSLRDVSGQTPCEIFKHTFLQQASISPSWSRTELQLQILGIFEDIVDGGVLRLSDESLDWSEITDNPESLRQALQSQYKEVIDNAKNGIVIEAVDGSNAFHAQAALVDIHDAPTDLRSLEQFISTGIDTNDYDNQGRTPLEAIITQPRDYETELTTSEKVSLLIDKGKASVHSRNRLGHTPLYSAAIRGLDRTVEALLLRGSHVNIRANDGLSLLQAVINAGHRAFVEYCESGLCQYHEAQCSRIEECKILLERYGAVPDPTLAQAMGYPARRSSVQ